MYSSYQAVAQHYLNSGDYTTAVYFHEKCLEIAEMMSNSVMEAEANHWLGVDFDQLGDKQASIRFHERHLEISRANSDAKGMQNASMYLIDMYKREADELVNTGKMQAAIESFTKCLDAAMVAEDARAEGLANHKLGLVFMELEESLSYQQNYLSICREVKDREGEAKAYASLARGYRQLHENEKAIAYLQSYLKISTENGSKVLVRPYFTRMC